MQFNLLYTDFSHKLIQSFLKEILLDENFHSNFLESQNHLINTTKIQGIKRKWHLTALIKSAMYNVVSALTDPFQSARCTVPKDPANTSKSENQQADIVSN